MTAERIRKLLDTPNDQLTADDRMDIDSFWNVQEPGSERCKEVMDMGLLFEFHVRFYQSPDTAKTNIQVGLRLLPSLFVS